jgi:multidrug efflux pump subunit AcrA (membrane-fusion protein)
LITSEAFQGISLSGHIISESAEADSDTASRAPTFNVRAAINDDGDSHHDIIRIGMSARMAINLNEASSAIVVPIDAVQRQASGSTVRVLDQKTRVVHDQPIVLGQTTPSGIEVASGLVDGDVVVLP